MEKMERLWESHSRMVYQSAWRVWRKTGGAADIEELISVAQFAFTNAVRAFDPDRGNAFSSFLVPYVYGMLHNHLRDAMKHSSETCLENADTASSPDCERAVEFRGILAMLEGDAKHLADLVLDAPPEVLENIHSHNPWFLRAAIKSYLIQQCEWTNWRYEKAYFQLKSILT